VDATNAVRVLTVDDLDLAIDLLVPAMREAALNEWLLGEWSDDSEVQRWLIELKLLESLRAGYVLGGFDRADLVGVLMWTPPEPFKPVPEPRFQRRSLELLKTRPQLVQRLAEFQRIDAENRRQRPPVAVALVGRAPRARGTDMMAKLLAPVFDAARAARSGVWFATASPDFGASWGRRFGFEPDGEYVIGPVTMHVFLKPYEAT